MAASLGLRDSLGFPALAGDTARGGLAAVSQVNRLQDARRRAWAPKAVPAELPDAGAAGLPAKYHELLFDKDLKNLCRQGIPTELRPTMWFWLSGGFALQATALQAQQPAVSADVLYTRLASSSDGLDDLAIDSIEEGLHKLDPAFRLNTVFQTGKGSEALARIMYALLRFRPNDLHYSRNLHQLAAFVLVVMGVKREQQAFWTLLGLIQNKLFPLVNGQVQLGGFIEQGVLELLVQKKAPRLALHLAKMGSDLSVVSSGWFACLFTSQLPPETAVRVWDAVLSEGVKVAHRVALALIKRYEAVILGCSQLQVMKKILDLRISRTTDDEELMSAAFRGVGSMPGSLLAGFRQQVIAGPAYARFLAVQQQTLSLRLEQAPPTAVAVLNPASGVKGWLGRSLSRISNTSTPGIGGGRDSAAGGSSQAASECGYNSDGGESLPSHRKRTASGRPHGNVRFE